MIDVLTGAGKPLRRPLLRAQKKIIHVYKLAGRKVSSGALPNVAAHAQPPFLRSAGSRLRRNTFPAVIFEFVVSIVWLNE